MKQIGFTLIELMIVVAIVGILAAIAIPAYQDFVARSQVAEGIAKAQSLRVSLSEYYRSQGNIWPAANTYDESTGGRYSLASMHDNAGVITVTMRNASPVTTAVQGNTFTLSPVMNAGNIEGWTCAPGGANAIDVKYLPSGCQN